MKNILTTLIVFISATVFSQDGIATTSKKAFSRTTTVSTEIKGTSSEVWNLLTNADKYKDWNSTLVYFDGEIKEGAKISLVTTLDTARTFQLKVEELVTNEKMVWSDKMGERVYTLTKTESGVLFTMTEKIGGLMFPLFAKKIPSFDEQFEQFARDLKGAVEAGR